MGLVNAVVEPEHLAPAAHELAARLAAGPTAAYAAIKQSLAFAASATLTEALGKEAELQVAMGATEDHHTSTAAFVAKQAPVFIGADARSVVAGPLVGAIAAAGRRALPQRHGVRAARASSSRCGRRPSRWPASAHSAVVGPTNRSPRRFFSSLAIAFESADVDPHRQRPAGRTCSAGAKDHSSASNPRARRDRTARALEIVASILARLRTIPASASRRATSGRRIWPPRRRRSREGRTERQALAQDDQPRQPGLERLQAESRSNSACSP
jgi:hypothetical protein